VETPTATLVVLPTPTWDGTPPPPTLDDVPRMPPARLDRALRGDTPVGLESGVTAVDVRSLAAFEQAQIPGALHIPLEELSERAGELDGDQTIVLYDLVLSEREALQAAMLLYALGFTEVAVLEGGIQRWYAQGYPIEGTWLTPTPDEVGPPWTLTPADDRDQGAVTATVALTATVAVTQTLPAGSATPALTVTLTLTPTRTGP
jgi:rhodanese-related sulfurtransferase